jgi:hypothetical protein
MPVDTEYAKYAIVLVALIAFNAPIFLAWRNFRNVPDLNELVQEKAPDGTSSGSVSYSRVTGLVGAVVVASLFWIMSNVTIAVAILNPGDLDSVLGGVTKLFFVGAALFVPYAFNQIKTLIQ